MHIDEEKSLLERIAEPTELDVGEVIGLNFSNSTRPCFYVAPNCIYTLHGYLNSIPAWRKQHQRSDLIINFSSFNLILFPPDVYLLDLAYVVKVENGTILYFSKTVIDCYDVDASRQAVRLLVKPSGLCTPSSSPTVLPTTTTSKCLTPSTSLPNTTPTSSTEQLVNGIINSSCKYFIAFLLQRISRSLLACSYPLAFYFLWVMWVY